MKPLFSLVIVFLFSFLTAQNIERVETIEKIKIGKYKYELLLKSSFNVEKNISIISYSLKHKNKEQWLGTLLSYRKTGSSKNYTKKIDEGHPSDPRSLLKDGIILSEGNINIDGENKEIIIVEKTFYKDDGFEESFVSTKRIYKQRIDGFFDLKSLSEINNEY